MEPKPFRYLQLVRKSAKQMGNLVDDLLRFSRLKRQDLKPQPVHVDKMVRDVWEELQPERENREIEAVANLAQSIQDTNARMTSDPLPRVCIHQIHLVQLFHSLISNSLKYLHPDRRTAIHVSAEQRGIGLAICSRIVQHYCGRIWAASEPGRGADFFFELSTV